MTSVLPVSGLCVPSDASMCMTRCGIGDTDVVQVSRSELRQREPHLGTDALGAVFIPGG